MDKNIIRQADMILDDCRSGGSEAIFAATMVAMMMGNEGYEEEALYLLNGLEKIVEDM